MGFYQLAINFAAFVGPGLGSILLGQSVALLWAQCSCWALFPQSLSCKWLSKLTSPTPPSNIQVTSYAGVASRRDELTLQRWLRIGTGDSQRTSDEGSRRNEGLVEQRGIEPMTSALRTRKFESYRPPENMSILSHNPINMQPRSRFQPLRITTWGYQFWQVLATYWLRGNYHP